MNKQLTRFEFTIKDNVLKGFEAFANSPTRRAEVVTLPDSFTTIGVNAMKRFDCERLVMPPSLKTIRCNAFNSAKIDEIDFSRCKLESIESQAFTECKIKAELPDTVKYLGADAVAGLVLGKEKKLRLPSSLIFTGTCAIDLYDIYDLEVDESLVADDSGLEGVIAMTSFHKVGYLILNVRREGKLVCRIPMPSYQRGDIENCNICGNAFNYANYDVMFKDSKERRKKTIIAAFRVMFPEGLTDEAAKDYRNYVIANLTFLLKGFEEDLDIIKLYDDAGLITCFRLKQLLENARLKNNADATTSILDLLNRKSGSKAKSLIL